MVKFMEAVLLIASLVPLAHCALTGDSSIDTSLPTFKNKAYHIETESKLNWFGALHYCKRQNMELASIQSLAEHEFLVNYIKDQQIAQYYWIAGNDLEFNDPSNFYWANTGQRMDFAKWSANSPDNYKGKENCVHMFSDTNGAWNDNQCTEKMQFICQTSTGNGWTLKMIGDSLQW